MLYRLTIMNNDINLPRRPVLSGRLQRQQHHYC